MYQTDLGPIMGMLPTRAHPGGHFVLSEIRRHLPQAD
jgi:hypothetical protein